MNPNGSPPRNSYQSSPYGQPNPPYGQQNPSYGQQNPPYGQQNPPYAQQKSSYGNSNQTYGQPFAASPYTSGPLAPSYDPGYAEAPVDYSKLGPPKPPTIATTSAYKDVWATVLFWLTQISLVIMASFAVPHLNEDVDITNKFITPGQLGGLLGMAVAIGLALSFVYLTLMQKYAGHMIVYSFWLTLAVNVAMAILMFSVGGIVPGVFILLFAVLLGWWFYMVQGQIPFAKLMLKTVTRLTSQFPGTLWAGLVGAIIATGHHSLWAVTMAGFAIASQNQGSQAGIFLFLVFVLYFTNQVIRNTVHVTVSGVFATVYFMGVFNPANNKVELSVQNPTSKAAVRALTTSFGPICFGSLLIALIQTLRTMIRMARDQAREDNNIFAMIILCCVECIVQCFQDLLEYFNHYAFVQVAIYGKDYCDAGRATWNLIKERGLEAVINDNLIGFVLGIGHMFMFVIAGAFGYLYVVQSGMTHDPAHYAFGVILCAFIATSLFNIMVSVIESGTAATYVCIAEDPATLARNQPVLFAKLQSLYPHVRWGMRSTVS